MTRRLFLKAFAGVVAVLAIPLRWVSHAHAPDLHIRKGETLMLTEGRYRRVVVEGTLYLDGPVEVETLDIYGMCAGNGGGTIGTLNLHHGTVAVGKGTARTCVDWASPPCTAYVV